MVKGGQRPKRLAHGQRVKALCRKYRISRNRRRSGLFQTPMPPDHEFATHGLGGRLRLIHIRESRSFLILR